MSKTTRSKLFGIAMLKATIGLVIVVLAVTLCIVLAAKFGGGAVLVAGMGLFLFGYIIFELYTYEVKKAMIERRL